MDSCFYASMQHAPSTSTGTCDSSHRVEHCVELQMGKLMLNTKTYTEFERWWKEWMSKCAQNRVAAERSTAKKPGAGVERGADSWPGNLANKPDDAMTQQ